MKEEEKLIKHIMAFLKASWIFLFSFIKVALSIIKFFLISPFIPIMDLWKKYLSKIKENVKEVWFKKLFSKENSFNDELVRYTLSFLMLIFMVWYSVFSMPLDLYNLYINNKITEKYSEEIKKLYNQDIYWFKDKYSKEIYEWVNQYNIARNNRNCDFMKYVSVDLLQWEKNTLKNIPIDKKYSEEYVLREDYKCWTYDNINEKSYFSIIEITSIELIDNNSWKDKIIKATWFLAHSKTLEWNYIGLSKRKFTLWKLDNWKTWRINNIDNIK